MRFGKFDFASFDPVFLAVKHHFEWRFPVQDIVIPVQLFIILLLCAFPLVTKGWANKKTPSLSFPPLRFGTSSDFTNSFPRIFG